MKKIFNNLFKKNKGVIIDEIIFSKIIYRHYENLFHSDITNIIDNVDSLYMNTKSSLILLSKPWNSMIIIDFKDPSFLPNLFMRQEEVKNIRQAYNLCRYDYLKSLTMDDILDKISIGELDCLTKEELIFLLNHRK